MAVRSFIFLSASQQRHLRRGFGVFVFHKIAPTPARTRDPFEYCDPAGLEQKLAALTGAGFQATALDQFALAAPGSFALTFDDGYANLIKGALPVLERRKVSATTFLIAGKLGGQNDWDLAKGDVAENLMDQAQVQTWLAAGNQIGSHSLTHPNLRKIALAAAREEIFASRKKLEDTFGVPIKHFCYPYGAYTEAIRDLVGEAGYTSASTVKLGVHERGAPPLELKRLAPLSGREWFRKISHRLRRRCWP